MPAIPALSRKFKANLSYTAMTYIKRGHVINFLLLLLVTLICAEKNLGKESWETEEKEKENRIQVENTPHAD